MRSSCLKGLPQERRRWTRISIFPENAGRLVRWLHEENDTPETSADDPGPDRWWRIIRPGSEVRLYQRGRDDVGEGVLVGPVWQDGIRYWVDTPGDGRVVATDEQLTPQGSSFDWQMWNPSTGRDQELQTERDF